MSWRFECHTCDRIFASWQSRDNHCNAKGHRRPDYECDQCDRWFNSETARVQHMRSRNHFTYECRVCVETWPTEKSREQHEIDDHYYCDDCDRFFSNRNNINAHLKSRAHRPANSIACPFCQAGYTTATGVAHHLERGACPRAPNVDRDTLYEFVRSKDPCGLITKHLIEWHGSDSYEATERAWNGYAYQCYLCPKSFAQLHSLNSHLSSPAHQQALYHCPKCRKESKTLGALINHFESEVCGFMRFDGVQTTVDNLIRSGRLLT